MSTIHRSALKIDFAAKGFGISMKKSSRWKKVEVLCMVGPNRSYGRMGASNVRSSAASNRSVSSNVLNQRISRGGFVKTMGAGVAGLGLAASGFGGVARATGGIINVPPATGVSTIDTPNIQNAMDAALAAGPGTTVLFPAGHYKIHTEIYTIGFDGNVIGAGIDNTIIEAVRAPDGTRFQPQWHFDMPGDVVDGEPRTSIFMFQRTDGSQLTVKGMTLKCDDPAPCEPVVMWNAGIFETLASFICDFYGLNKTTTIENVKFDGEIAATPTAEGTHNCVCGIITWPEGNSPVNPGVVTVKNCEAEMVDYGIYLLGYNGSSSSATIDGFIGHDVGNLAWVSSMFVGSTQVTNCHVTNSEGYVMIYVDWSDKVAITNCTIKNSMASFGIYAGWGANNTSIVNNQIEGFTAQPWGSGWEAPICIEMSQHCIVANNTLVDVNNGPVCAGVRLSSYGTVWWDGYHCKNNTVQNNNYARSGLPGWSVGTGCVVLEADWNWVPENGPWGAAVDNFVVERLFPAGTNMCNQVYDMTMSPTLPLGLNKIPGWQGVCGLLPENVRAMISQKRAQHDQKMLELGNRLEARAHPGKRPGQFGN